MEIDYTIKGTKLPNLPKGTEYRCIHWNHDTESKLSNHAKKDLISFGHTYHKGYIYILYEEYDYFGELYYMTKLNDIQKLTKEQEQPHEYFEYINEYDKSWKLGKIYKLNENGKVYFESGKEPEGDYAKDTKLFKPSTKEAFENQNKKQETMRKISHFNAQRIVDIACETWKEILFGKWGKDIVLKKDIEITEEDYQKMRKACTEPQHKLFDQIFGEDKPQFKVGDWVIGWFTTNADYTDKAWEIGDIDQLGYIFPKKSIRHNTDARHLRLATEEEIKAANVFPDGTPCLVRDNLGDNWKFYYADGKGEFYAFGKKSGNSSIPWRYSMKLDMDNLPIN